MNLEKLVDSSLFENIIFLEHALVEPRWMYDTRNGIGDALKSGRDGDDFLNASAQSANVVLPIENLTNVEIDQRIVFQPFLQVVTFHTRLRVEDGQRYSSFRHRGTCYSMLSLQITMVQC